MTNLKTIWNRLTTIGVRMLPDYSFQKQITISVNQFSALIAIINLTAGVAVHFFMTPSPALLVGAFTEVIIACIPLFLNYYRCYTAASITLYLILCTATCFFTCLLGNLVEFNLMIVILLASPRFIFTEGKIRNCSYLVAFIIIVLVLINRKFGLIQSIDVPISAQALLSWTVYAVIIILLTAIFDRHDKIKASLKELAQRYAEQMTAYEYADTIIENVFVYEQHKDGFKAALVTELIDIRLMLRSVVGLYRYLAVKKHVMLELNAKNIPQHIYCDERKLRRIVACLLHDAVKATNNNTTVAIDVHLFGHLLVIVVCDCSSGINKNMKLRRLKPFGLADLVGAFQGTMDVINNQTGGVTVTISLLLPGIDS